MDTPRIDIVRALRPAPELRQEGDGDGDGSPGTMEGHFSVFDTPYEVNSVFEGHFLETVAPGAFRETMDRDRDQVKVTFNHGYDVLGDQVLGPIGQLNEDRVGAFYSVPLFRGVPDMLVEGLRAGVYGSSFRFKVTAEEWDDEPEPSDTNPRGIPERTITGVRLMEFGPVTFPASPSATAGLRSLTDRYYDKVRQHDHSRFEAALRAAEQISPTVRPNTGDLDRGASGRGDDGGTQGGTTTPVAHARRALILKGLPPCP